jgi:DNA-binding CsgD family transcriptional regulator
MIACGVREPGSFSHLVPDHVEVLIGLGRLEDARTVIDEFEGQAHAVGGRARVLAAMARCRGLLLAASDNIEGALAHLEDAVTAGEVLPYPLDLGRSLLALGAQQRRAKQKRVARESLERSLEVFDSIGARLYAEQARSELGRISGRARGTTDLTETERRVAELVAEGHTNQEVADRLYMSVRTVEANLTRIYRKLGVRGRTGLSAGARQRTQ